MTPLEIVLGAMVVFLALSWTIDHYRWARQERELFDRIMAKNFQEYMLGEQARVEMKKNVVLPPVSSDILPVT
ncbi:unnamed protein product [marine sediment metagenome]|uniref:Uncharacterized protein n=1 Tax=marine sediment metagenome TaxID=412755 RepID=X0UL57_9ZZZZ